jgi:hypothetical protein
MIDTLPTGYDEAGRLSSSAKRAARLVKPGILLLLFVLSACHGVAVGDPEAKPFCFPSCQQIDR